uniref:sigma-54 interaction domain-containing protein n=1 Tax=Oryzibacter oryziterrae TaxID=2766474 RepID=UPI001F0248E0
PLCRCTGRHAAAWGDARAEEIVPPGPVRPRFAATAVDAQASAAIGASASFLRARQMLERAAATEATVLFMGESGVGKELFSRMLHDASRRRAGPFVAVNCAALPETLMEAELFGVEKGAFTGAQASRPGRFERANGGTLFLDEVGTLTLSAQAKLLRALQERQIDRVGDTLTRSVDVRVVAATNVDLREEVRAGRFREDLYYRLNVVPIDLPSLRDRRDDIPLLIDHFLKVYSQRYGKTSAGFTPRAMATLLDYDYPGNIRELQNLVERGVIFSDEAGRIDVPHVFRPGDRLPAGSAMVEGSRIRTGAPSEAPATQSFEELEREAYRTALGAAGGNISAAARSLGLRRPQLEYRLRKHGLA